MENILVRVRNRHGETALHIVLDKLACFSALPLVRCLLAAKSDPMACDGEERTPLNILSRRPGIERNVDLWDVVLHAIYSTFNSLDNDAITSSMAVELAILNAKCDGAERAVLQAVRAGAGNV